MPLSVPSKSAFQNMLEIWWDTGTIASGNPSQFFLSASQAYQTATRQIPAAIGDTVEFKSVGLEAGQWRISLLGLKSTTSGKHNINLDSISVFSDLDWYASTTTYNVIQSTTVILTSSKRYSLYSTVTGKNAAATDYRISMTKVYLEKIG